MAGVTRDVLPPPPNNQRRLAFRRKLVAMPPAALFRGTAAKRFVFPSLGSRKTVRISF